MNNTLTTFPAADLKPGDSYEQVYADPVVMVTILRAREPATDFFGRSGHFRYWATRADTGAQGWVTFGPGGIVCNARQA